MIETGFQQSRNIEALSTLAGGIAHNFNNLLMGIQANVSLMLFEIDSAHPYYKRLESIKKLVQSGSKLNSQLRHFRSPPPIIRIFAVYFTSIIHYINVIFK